MVFIPFAMENKWNSDQTSSCKLKLHIVCVWMWLFALTLFLAKLHSALFIHQFTHILLIGSWVCSPFTHIIFLHISDHQDETTHIYNTFHPLAKTKRRHISVRLLQLPSVYSFFACRNRETKVYGNDVVSESKITYYTTTTTVTVTLSNYPF